MLYLWIGLGALLVILLLWAYNSMVSLRTRADAAFSDVDTQLKKRHDLIPQLVEVAKGYMTHEKDIFTKVAALRSDVLNTQDVQKRSLLEHDISSSLNNFFILVEKYPDLKAAPQFITLQQNLAHAEDDISKSRRYYNAVVRDYNSLIRSFPLNLMAGMAQFLPRPFFTMEEAEKVAPSVSIA